MTTTKKATKKAPAKAVPRTKLKRVSPAKTPQMRSFTRANAHQPFFRFKFTEQTVYWLVLSTVVLALGIWVIKINSDVQQIYDEIDRINAVSDALITPFQVFS